MKKFNVERELSKLDKKRLSDKNKSNFMSMLIPFFVMGFSCVGLIAASYSLDANSVSNEIIDNIQKERYTDLTVYLSLSFCFT